MFKLLSCLFMVAAISSVCLTTASKADDITTGAGNELITECNQHNSQSKNSLWAFCIGYVHGVIEEHEDLVVRIFPRPDVKLSDNERLIYQAVSEALVREYCLPDNATREQSALVVSKYLSDNPDNLNLVAPDLVLAALHNAWPCPKSIK